MSSAQTRPTAWTRKISATGLAASQQSSTSTEDSNDSFKALLEQAAPLIGRVCKPAAALYLCCDIDQFHWLRDLFKGQRVASLSYATY